MVITITQLLANPVETVESFEQGFEHYPVISEIPQNPLFRNFLGYRRLTGVQFGKGLR